MYSAQHLQQICLPAPPGHLPILPLAYYANFFLQLSSRCSPLLHSTSDESHPSCPIGRSSPCHPLHREPGDCSRPCCCCIRFGASLVSPTSRYSSSLLSSLPFFPSSSPSFLCLFFFRSLAVPAPNTQSPPHQRLTRCLGAAQISPGIARRKLGRFSLMLTPCLA